MREQKNNHQLKQLKKSFLAVSYSLALSVSLSVSAETDDDSLGDISLEDLLNIEVTVASNFAETELEASSTVEVVFNRQWRDYGAENVGEAISHLPSTMVYPVPWGGSAVAIRGYASNLSVRGIAAVLDGIPMNTLRTGSALYEIRGFTAASFNRIEMLRGPGSALYGSDAFHGVLSMKTYQSEMDNTAFNLDFSNEGFLQANVNHTTITGNGISINASVTAIDQSEQDIPYTFTIPATSTELTFDRDNSYDAYMGVFKIGVKHSDTFKTSYGLYFKGADSVESVGAGQSQSDSGSIFMQYDITDGDDDLSAFKFGFEKQFDHDITFEGKAYHWTSESNFFTDIRTINDPPVGTFNNGKETLTGIDVLVKQPDNAWNTQWVVGLGYKKGEVDKNTITFTVPDDRDTVLVTSPDPVAGFTRNVKSLIFSAKSKFFEDKLQILYGGRMDKYSDFGNQTTPRYGAIFLPNKNNSIKFLYGEAFRAPITAELFGGGRFKGNQNLNPEIIETTELIYMYQGDFWKFNVTLFESEWTDGINLGPTTDPLFTAEYANIGQNEADGIEVTYRGELNHWRWDISASWVNSEAITADGKVDYAAFPERIYNINFGYNFEAQGLDLFVTNRLQQSALEGPISTNVPEPAELDDYFATDVTLDWTINKQWNLQAGVRNLFDRNNFIPGVWNNENGVATLGRYFQLGMSFQL